MTTKATHDEPPTEAVPGELNDAEWVRVVPKSRRGRRQLKPHEPLSNQQLPAQMRTAPLRPVTEINAEYIKIRDQWHDSDAYASLSHTSQAIASSVGPITQAVCLGIGSFDPPDGAWEAKRRTFLQFIAFLTMVEEIEKSTKSSIPCFFQEPLFTDSDKSFIQSLGHHVVDSPKGCDLVGLGTFLFGIHLYRPLYAMALKDSPPAVFVGTGWDVWDQVNLSETTDLHNLEKMEGTYAKTSFPQDASGTAFSSTSIYWRSS